MLKKHTGSRVTVFAVWEPILMTDMQRPGTSIMARIGDPRVRQFWDPDHAVAAAMKAGLKTRPDCCESDGVLWDLAAVYAPGALWRDTLPEPVFIDGTIVKAQAGLESVIER